MSQGIFHVDFKASTGDYGDGLIVVKDGAVNGGDANYLYRGTIPKVSGPFESKFIINKWRNGNTNVVGIDNYELEASGSVDYEGGTFALKGSVVGQPQLTIDIMGKRISDAS
jgi:hypothetical protein